MPKLSVVICSLNGADGVRRCLLALEAQTIRSALELIVVDDGSTDSTSQVADAGGATVVRHARNLGVSTARNSGIRLASAPIVAFLDDDCEPSPYWAEKLLASFNDDVLAVGGLVTPAAGAGVVLGYLSRHNPISPQELDLAVSNKIAYRFWLYLKRQWTGSRVAGRRAVVAMPSANLAVRRAALLEVRGFDERIRFGGEDDDLCRRLRTAFPDKQLVFDPAAAVVHHFEPSLSDLMRRSRAYGLASATMHRKYSDVRPTFFPFPALMLAMIILSMRHPRLILPAVVMPLIFYPRAVREAISERRIQVAADAYLQLLREANDNYGFITGWWRFRREFARENGPGSARPSRRGDRGA